MEVKYEYYKRGIIDDWTKAAGINEYPKIGEFKNQSIYNIVNVFDSNAIAALEAKGDEPLFFIL